MSLSDSLLDHADEVARHTWSLLIGHDAAATLHVIGTLLAGVEQQLGWERQRLLEHVSEIADDCDTLH